MTLKTSHAYLRNKIKRLSGGSKPYYDALRAADIAWENGQLDVSIMAAYLQELLKGQLTEK